METAAQTCEPFILAVTDVLAFSIGVAADFTRPSTTTVPAGPGHPRRVMELVALQSLYNRYGRAILERSAVDAKLAEEIGRHAASIREQALEGHPCCFVAP